MLYCIGRIILVLTIMMSADMSAQAGTRVALVVGNSAYRHVEALPNPANDARVMALALEKVGFQVISGIDLDKSEMDRKIDQFSTLLTGAGCRTIFLCWTRFSSRKSELFSAMAKA